MNDWDTLRKKNEELLARPRFHWTPQRKAILKARAHELETGEPFMFPDFSDEWKRRQLSVMRKHLQVADDESLINIARAEGIIKEGA